MRALFAVLLCGMVLQAQAESFSGKVVAVLDGDTVMVLRDGKPVKLRLVNIDAPEKAQPYGRQSRQSLLELVGKKLVQVDAQAVDQYGRLIGTIKLDGLDVNREQLKRGMAWEYSHYHSDKTFIALQHEAQQARRGLWAQANQQAPWQWRKQHPTGKPGAPTQDAAIPRGIPVMMYDMACGRKRFCSEMVSCEEANFYLTRCGVKTLDGDHDGQPCKALCAGK